MEGSAYFRRPFHAGERPRPRPVMATWTIRGADWGAERVSGRTVGTGIGSVIGASRHAFRGQWSGAERFAQQQRSDQDSRVGAGRARHAQKRFESTDFPNSMNVCGGDTVSRSLTHVRTAPRAQVVEKMALSGLAAVISREPAEQVLWWLGTFLSIGL